MSNPHKLTSEDYKHYAKTNVWGLEAENIRRIEDGEGFDSGGHWNFNKINDKDYEAVYDGLYMHVFGSLKDLMARENEIHNYEYDAEASQESGEETFTDSEGNEREYSVAKNGKDILPLPSPRGYKRLTTGKLGSALEQKLRQNNIKIITTPDPDISGYVVIHVDENDIEKAKDVISGRRRVSDATIDKIYKEVKALFPSTMKNLYDTPGVNPIGGYNYDKKEDLGTAKKFDLITLPKKIEGTNCANCEYVKILDANKGLGFCNHKFIMLPVTERMCCALWNNEGVSRSWEKENI